MKSNMVNLYASEKEYQDAFGVADRVKLIIEPYLNTITTFKDCVICGSLGKGTMIKGKSDIDIFIRFDTKETTENFKIFISEINKMFEKSEIKHGTFPYVEAIFDGYKLNLVPCYYTNSISDIISPVDRTPHHLDFINNNLTLEQKKDVVKLKDLLTGLGIYGADDITKGFSGYVCEVLIYKYKTFEEVLNTFAHTEDKPREGVFRIIDPIDEHRHLDAAISNESFGKFVLECRNKLGLGSIEINEKFEIGEIEKIIKNNSIIIKHDTMSISKTTKETKKIVNILNKNRFNVLYTVSLPYYSVILVENKKPNSLYVKKIDSITFTNASKLLPKISTKNTIKIFVDDDMKLNLIKNEKVELDKILKDYEIVDKIEGYEWSKIISNFL